MKLFLWVFLIFILSTSCDPSDKSETEVYVGRYRVADQLIPYPYLFVQNNDFLSFLDDRGLVIDKIQARIKHNKDIKFQKNHFKITRLNEQSFLAADVADTLKFFTFKDGSVVNHYAAIFEKSEEYERLNLVALKEKVAESIWKYEVISDENSNPNDNLKIIKELNFTQDSLTVITNYYYNKQKIISENESKGYTIFEVDSRYFLSYHKEKDNPQSIYQIKKVDTNQIELVDFSAREIKNILYTTSLITNDEFDLNLSLSNAYSNCFDGYKGEYYFDTPDVTFDKGNDYLIDLLSKNAPTSDSSSGYITVHFNVNCNQQLGEYGLIQMDRSYKATSFSYELIKHIFDEVSHLKNFPSLESNKNWFFYKDNHAFLMFKIGDGKIIDVCP
jgi:hypothetical protein